ncbi:hypothetical protein ACJIZ3_010994 [Penstemon smallii]|uniref:Uncharacterized protein n=1 Tax=Penstemon smallii TaxID=265156 RepID=A0ABD3ULI3_9LAMI
MGCEIIIFRGLYDGYVFSCKKYPKFKEKIEKTSELAGNKKGLMKQIENVRLHATPKEIERLNFIYP